MQLGLSHECRQSHRLDRVQKLALKQLIELELKLRAPSPPEAVRGLEGMQIAHEILKQRESTGVLIGGLAERVWNQRRTEEELLESKDVDVLVLDEDFRLEQAFEGGIDWWLPETARITTRDNYGGVQDLDQKWYENGNGVVLSFGVAQSYGVTLKPGLYIPDVQWLVDMREYEIIANTDTQLVDLDEYVLRKFTRNVEQRIQSSLPKFIAEEFAGHILSTKYSNDSKQVTALYLEEFTLETLSGINKFKNL